MNHDDINVYLVLYSVQYKHLFFVSKGYIFLFLKGLDIVFTRVCTFSLFQLIKILGRRQSQNNLMLVVFFVTITVRF
jgi:hypothetical protein